MRQPSSVIAIALVASFFSGAITTVAAAADSQKPAVMVAQAASKATDPSTASETSCGFLKLLGLAVRPALTKCELSERTHSEGGTVEVASLIVRLAGKNEYAHVFAQKDRSAWGWKTLHGDQIMDGARRWAGARLVGGISAVTGGSFRHVTFAIKDNAADWSCAYGNLLGSVLARGNEGYKHTARIVYCEIGTHRLSDADVSRIQMAMSMN